MNARISLALLFLLVAVLGIPATAAERPNIVFVLFDDMGYGQPPCYRGESEFRTPNLDRLAQQGMRLTDAHSASGVCTPTRYGLLTGRYPWRIGQFGVLTTYSAPIIPPERLTVASLLKQHGYHTACIGKWHLGLRWQGKPGSEKSVPVGSEVTEGPQAIGFDYFCGFTHARNIGTVIEQDRVIANVQAVENQPLLIRKTLAYLEERAEGGEPFFLYFPMCPPHTPIAPAPQYEGKSGLSDQEAKYGDWIYQGDDMLGQILEALDHHGLAENTLVMVSSDNGAERREYPPLRASKRSIYEGGHRVPTVVRWPGKVQAGSVSHVTVCLNDLLATVADFLEVQLPDSAGEDSYSILPVLLGQVKQAVREATVHQSSSGDLAIRQGPWKLLLFKGGQCELYNLATDLGETQDIAGEHPEVVARLAKLMQSYVERGRSTPGAPQRNDVQLSLKALERLGSD